MINSLDYQTLQRTAERRRSLYDLSADLPITTEELHGLLRDILRTTPSGFNSQTARLVLLSGAEHRQAWDVIQRCVQPLTEPAAFEKTVAKMDGFRRAAGTILFFEDGEILRDLEQRFPKFANNVPLFSAHTSAMHQYAAWTQLAALNIGANDVANNMGPAVGARALTMGGALLISAICEAAPSRERVPSIQPCSGSPQIERPIAKPM